MRSSSSRSTNFPSIIMKRCSSLITRKSFPVTTANAKEKLCRSMYAGNETLPPDYQPNIITPVPQEVPSRPIEPEFEPVPPETPPLGPFPGPDFPQVPIPSPPVPDPAPFPQPPPEVPPPWSPPGEIPPPPRPPSPDPDINPPGPGYIFL